MAMPTFYSTFWTRAYRNNKTYYSDEGISREAYGDSILEYIHNLHPRNNVKINTFV